MTKESCLGHNSSTINLKLYQKLNSEHFLFFFLTTKIEINLCVVMKTQVVLCVITLVNFILNHIFLSQKLFKTFMLHIERKQYERLELASILHVIGKLPTKRLLRVKHFKSETFCKINKCYSSSVQLSVLTFKTLTFICAHIGPSALLIVDFWLRINKK